MEQVASSQTKTKSNAFDKRIHEIDFFRGILIILVLMDHIFCNLLSFGASWWGEDSPLFLFFKWYWTGDIPGFYFPIRMFIQPMALMAFCFVSGVSCVFSKNNWKRAIETLIVYLVIFFGSNAIQVYLSTHGMEQCVRVDMDIIGVLGLCMLVYCCVQNRSWRIMVVVILATLLIYFYIMPNVKENLMRIYGSVVVNKEGHEWSIAKVWCPVFWYPYAPDTWNAYTYQGYVSQADYVALFPYISFFFAGVLFSMKFYIKEKKSLFKRHEFERPVCFLGRHTFVIYLSHIAIIWGIFYGIDAIVKLL